MLYPIEPRGPGSVVWYRRDSVESAAMSKPIDPSDTLDHVAMLRLVSVRGPQIDSVELTKAGGVMGRGAASEVRLPDATVSRRHAAISYAGGIWLLSPVGARYQVVGVYSQALVEPLAGALVRLGAKRALVVHGDDGLDELTTTGPSVAALVDAGQVRTLRIEPETLGLTRCSAADLAGGDAKANAAITRRVLAGEKGPQRDIVLLNAAAALWVVEAVTGLEEGLERAASSIDEGAATLKLEALRAATERAGEALSR